jgi:hypothetical protein
MRRFDLAHWSKAGFDMHCVTVEHENGRWEAIFTKAVEDAHFIAQAREALPYWLQRVKELEERLKALEERRCEMCRWWNRMPGHQRGTCCWRKSITNESLEQDTPFVVFEDGATAWLETEPSFGCVCWEARE